ncbi:MAG: TAXI family TRAP transporter solute-binding subunit, partial [Nitrospirota bacterium]|nr:TAXI family TRAP transporter solute-binding subunit [Nitrospirota bacterium]
VGNPGSGQRATMEVVMAAKGWDMGDFAGVAEFGSSVQANELCRDKFDAAVFTAAHPSLSVMEAIAACDAELVPATGPKIDQLVAANPHYVAAPIPGDAYETVPDPLPSFGVVATVVATSEMSAEVVYEMVKAVFENLDEFRRLHPAFTNLDRDFMLSSHHTAPLHEGAVRYFQEVGVM